MCVCAVGLCVWLPQFVYVYVAKKIVPYRSKKNIAECIILLACENTSEVVFYVYQVVQMEQFMLVLFRSA